MKKLTTREKVVAIAILVVVTIAWVTLATLPKSISTGVARMDAFPVADTGGKFGASTVMTIGRDGILADMALTSANTLTVTTANPPYPCRVQAYLYDDGANNTLTGTLVVIGTDQFGARRTETITLAETVTGAAGTAGVSTYAYAGFNSAVMTLDGTTTHDTTDRMRIGTTTIVGLPRPIGSTSDLVNLTVNTANTIHTVSGAEGCLIGISQTGNPFSTTTVAYVRTIASPTVYVFDHSIDLASGSSGFGTCDGFVIRVWSTYGSGLAARASAPL